MELTKREKAIALAMLKYGYSVDRDIFMEDGITGTKEKMVFDIEYMVDSGDFEGLVIEAKKDIDSVGDLKKIYRAVNAEENCHLVVGEGGHNFYAKEAWDKMLPLLNNHK